MNNQSDQSVLQVPAVSRESFKKKATNKLLESTFSKLSFLKHISERGLQTLFD